ncbi:uncharacterized protein LOC143510801 [Brachyhypopomus gauderio]|uniref:uncharacterized protein LOC143510801 n=1 Tax=Brachyhypopomus gauderio TaxID=698409 RepID=UPI0040437AA3
MTNSIGDKSGVTRKEVFDRYLMYYSSVWAEGHGTLCKDAQVREGAQSAVLTQRSPAERFSSLAFYQILSQCVEYTARDCRNCVFRFIKVAEMLETLCVNLFLFPWKKEFKTLKKFTAHFVYNIQQVLPHETAKSILQSIGYCLENDTEYKLSTHVDLDMVKKMGFELFLARVECEYLLQVMGQRSHSECLDILYRRASLDNLESSMDATEDQPTSDAHILKQEVLKNDRLCESSLLNSASPQDHNVLQTIKTSKLEPLEVLDTTGCAEGRPPSPSIIDRSILEMQENYPDLAFRQKPIFTKPQTASKKERTKDPTVVQLHTVSTDMSGPQSIALHTESTTVLRKLQFPESVVEPQSTEEQPCVLRVRSVLQKPSFSPASATEVMELTEELDKLQMKDEPLKYPTEETAQGQQCHGGHDHAAGSPLCSPTEKTQTVPCSSSHEPSCSLAGCEICSRRAAELPQDDPIKEPPHSFYIPNCLSGCGPSMAPPTDQQGELQPNELWPNCL